MHLAHPFARPRFLMLPWFALAILVFQGCDRSSLGEPIPEAGLLPTIGLFDTFAGEDSILVLWETGNYPPFDFSGRRPAPRVTGVRVLGSSTGEMPSFRELAVRSGAGRDSIRVAGPSLRRSIYFRIETLDSLGRAIQSSPVLETQTGPAEEELAAFGPTDMLGGRYYVPFAWTRDGAAVLYIGGAQFSGQNLVRHELASGGEVPATAFPPGPARLSSVAMAPDSDRVAFTYSTGEQGGPYTIRVLDLATGALRQVSPGPVDSSPAWGPGGRLYFTRGTPGPPNVPQIHVLQPDLSDTMVPVLVNEQYKYGLSVDPSGERIAYDAYESGNPGPYRRSLALYTLPNRRVDTLVNVSRATNEAPSWDAQGEEIHFVSDRSGHREAWTFAVGTGILTQRTRTPEVSRMCWAVRPSPDGTMICVLTTDVLDPRYGTIRILRLR